LTRVAKTIEENCKDLIVELKQENTRSSRPRRGNADEKNDSEAGKEHAGSKRKLAKNSDGSENSSKKVKTGDKTSTSIIPPKKKTPVSGIVSMVSVFLNFCIYEMIVKFEHQLQISGQHYMDTKRYHEFLVWYTEKLQTLSKV
jgi:hypothetical protein